MRSAPPRIRTWTRSLRRRRAIPWCGAESREGIKPSRARLQLAILVRESAHGAGSGSRTRISSLEDCVPTVGDTRKLVVPRRESWRSPLEGAARQSPARHVQRAHLGELASLHRPCETMPGASATLSSPHPAQRSRERRHGCISQSRSFVSRSSRCRS